MLFRALLSLRSAAIRSCTQPAATNGICLRTATSVLRRASFGAYVRPQQAWEAGAGRPRLQTIPPLALHSAARLNLITQLRSASGSVSKSGLAGESVPTATEEPGPAIGPGQSKECSTCYREKSYLDFERTKTTVDGRTDTCRACLATFRARRAGKLMYHLSWSLELAMERGKVCSKCGVFKEARDFARHSKAKDELSSDCRGCHNKREVRLRQNVPLQTPRQCYRCGEVKLASKFHLKRGYPRRLCKACRSVYAAQWRTMIERSSMYLSRDFKKCGICGEVKQADSFYKNKCNTDGLTSSCKECLIRRDHA